MVVTWWIVAFFCAVIISCTVDNASCSVVTSTGNIICEAEVAQAVLFGRQR